MSRDNHNQRISLSEVAQTLILGNEINAVYGDTATLISKPSGQSNTQSLYLLADVDDWNVVPGDVHADWPNNAIPTASVTDGSASIPLKTGTIFRIPGIDALTVKGPNATSRLIYWWV
jgi:hypothetical protein